MIISIEKFLSITDKLVIDMRTKEEYESGHIIDAINFEILDYEERKKVSLLYNKGLNAEAYMLAYEYALHKLPKLFKIIKKHSKKQIVFYCSRGGSRSTIVYEVFKKLKGINFYKIKDGYKAYRQFVNCFFEESLDNYESVTIFDTIGLGIQRDILKSSKYLLVDLEKIIKPIENPFILLKDKNDYYNNRMVNYYIFEKLYESNTKKIVFILPIISKNTDILNENLYQLIDSGVRYYFSETIETRVSKIKEMYFENGFTLEVLIKFLNSKRKKMSNVLINEIIEALSEKRFNKSIELILLNYIDPMMDYFIKKDRVKQIKNMKEINKYLESWSE